MVVQKSCFVILCLCNNCWAAFNHLPPQPRIHSLVVCSCKNSILVLLARRHCLCFSKFFCQLDSFLYCFISPVCDNLCQRTFTLSILFNSLANEVFDFVFYPGLSPCVLLFSPYKLWQLLSMELHQIDQDVQNSVMICDLPYWHTGKLCSMNCGCH